MTLDFYLTRGMIERAALELGPTPYQETAAVSVWLALAGHGRRPIPKTNGATVGLPRQCEIRVVLTRVFSRPKISAWVPLGRRGEYGGVTYVSVSGCPFRWITPLFYPCLQMPGYPPYGVMFPDIRERWSGGIKYDGGSGGDGGSVGRAGTEACRIPISQSEREHFFDEGGVNESFCDGHQLRLRGVVVGNIVGGPITPALG